MNIPDWMGHSFFVAQVLQDDEYNSSGAAAAAADTAVATAVVALGVAFLPPTVAA